MTPRQETGLRAPRTACASILGLAAFFLCFVSLPALAQKDVFVGNDDKHWSALKEECTLIEQVPIVEKVEGISTVAAILSSIIGYHEQNVSILGPPVPGRLPSQVAYMSSVRPSLTASETMSLAEELYAIEARNRDIFVAFARKYPDQTEGAIRAHILMDAYGVGDNLAEGIGILTKMAAERLQTLALGDQKNLTGMQLRELVDEKQLTVLSIHGGESAYAVVGYVYGGEFVAVIDADAARSQTVPAVEVFLTAGDLQSDGDFATQARELLMDETVAVDAVTSCFTGRPPGIRFMNASALYDKAEVHVFRDWVVDFNRLSAREAE